jgi:hypothetical protein
MPQVRRHRRVIAFIWDFDRTLIPGNQQDPLFEEYGVDPGLFWEEVKGLASFHRARGEVISRDAAYLLHMLTYVEAGIFGGLTNARLRELGARLLPCPGIPEFMGESRRVVAAVPQWAAAGIGVEHYVVSAGLRPMIEGSCIAPQVDGIWANSFIENVAPPGYLASPPPPVRPLQVRRLGYLIDDTTKTRAVFEINKGSNLDPTIDVNSEIPEDLRPVPFANMIYVADGPSDVPAFSLLNQRGGRTLGVYTGGGDANFARLAGLWERGRIQGFAEADFRPGCPAHDWLMVALSQIAGEMLTEEIFGAEA